MRRAAVLAGVTLLAVFATACGHSDGTGTSPTAGNGAGGPTTVSAAAQATVVDAVHAACGKQVPVGIVAAIPGATPTYTPHYALGSSCQWHTDDISRRVLAVAVTTVPYIGWRRMQSTLTDQATVTGRPAVRGQVDGACTVLVDVDGVALEVDLFGVSDPTCKTTTALAGQILAGH